MMLKHYKMHSKDSFNLNLEQKKDESQQNREEL